ncbi:amidohydrolase family protein [Salinispora arenicola]|uniref:Amidohydrolase n=2 Tax=Salinispora arenicola TaxID=168697 RepID=A0A542XGS0_SALAC|nr:amidohydrolase family protein [Salinispora arenicola]MCN0152603.1 amidohydrolase family protein [Salinispora arenicola]MCN0179481.1 amidohydrolase family protein [Salinispora arenicola]NIL41420.1 amidohydrolase family protein [Salinispora arenicola]NIL56261.1 amidohydrolase family protein [Salinispora arenicola]NIL62109.1 amidohydrolase family protein [Salinispora arenicola]
MVLHVRGVLLPEDEVRDIWLVGDRVTFEPVAGAETVADGGFLLPGLTDAHCHIGIARGGAPVSSIDQARDLARTDRDAGVLAIRDAGSPYPYPELDDAPDLPRLARAGRHIAPPKRYLRNIGVEVGAAEVTATVTGQARAGNGWVKLVGDWIDRGVGDLAPAWDADTMAAAVRAAHAAGARAAVHTFSEAAVEIMVRAGVDSVEHGTGLSLDLIDLMARQGTALVPTMINIRTFGGIADQARAKFPGYADHMLALRDRFPDVVRAAYQAGVPIYVGTDAGGGIAHGLAAEEMLLLHERAGMPAEAVLAAASWQAREWLGFPGLVEGGLADLVVYPEDPRRDLRVVRSPTRVVLRGRLVR